MRFVMPGPAERARPPWSALAVVSAGGVLGALARYGIGHAWPTPASGFPWATFVINVTGCLLMGALMMLVHDVFTRHHLLQPFLGVGVLGGYTTFSTYSVEIRGLIAAGATGTAVLYLFATLAAALVAVFAGMAAVRAVRRWMAS
ncbi:hypothetical protein Ais01nite_24210 [Asanoa ishikariensis]|uniref:Fluoride-specific ion channel FluC n=1 Tax=Asanoa ishikariensis TaxID=137265 RepID=A0A1H3R5S0_9ACTN|nr:CrcB family protein [Asanoa ishikariensis]GIF64386.1 hypothetical protein Ais01nite_24210 [Asanoa ishikariensis]SDZ21027.1 CrcB protein [Asanoa ishikariensis]